MKKVFSVVVLALLLSSCADNKVIDGVEYEPYGWANYEDVKNDSITYKPVIGNAVWSVILVETIIAPVYFTGWAMMEPSHKKAQFVSKTLVK